MPLLRGEHVPWRDAFVIEHFSDNVFPRTRGMGYRAVRTERFKYIRYTDLQGMDELYDLEQDPYEMQNRIGDPQSGPVLDDLKQKLDRILAETR